MISVNDIEILPTIFPDNTSQIWKLPGEILEAKRARVEWNFASEGEFLQLAQLKILFDRHNIQSELYLPYLPYGRQDKDISNDHTFALLPFAKLLNTLAFEKVTILDPHSEKALQLITNSEAIYPWEQFAGVFTENGDVVCYPDAGAFQKYKKIYSDLPFVHGEKIRDQKTGTILSYELVGSPKGKRVLIVDDICDGGATFILLAKVLREAGAKNVSLFVSHGLFSKGTEKLFNSGIDKIYTVTPKLNLRVLENQTTQEGVR